MKKFSLLFVAPTLALLLLAVWPLISGERTLFHRDVLNSHFPLVVAQAEMLQAGEIPLVDPYRSGGQPLLGNPNGLPIYPTKLLHLLGSALWALNAHFWLHWLLAPWAGYWLGRAWGLRRQGAWAVGITYATSGFFLSQLNLYNLVAGAALAPAFVAACLEAVGRRWRPKMLALAALLWALLLLAGDPMYALLAFVLGMSAPLARMLAQTWAQEHSQQPWRQRLSSLTERLGFQRCYQRWYGLALAMIAGTCLAAPMLVEFVRILPLSFRGYWRYTAETAFTQSWDPRTILDWFLPLAVGNPDFSFWGGRFFDGNLPFFFSLFPGWLCLGLLVVAGRPRNALGFWAWGWVLAGTFAALGGHNPIMRWLFSLPGASSLRYPIKFWLPLAVAAALLCGVGFDRWYQGEGRRRLRNVLLVGWLSLFGLWVSLITLRGPAGQFLHQLEPQKLVGELFQMERLRWATQSFYVLLALLVLLLACRLVRRRPAVAGALLLFTHTASQLLVLQPLYDTDAVAPYQQRPELLDQLSATGRVMHGGFDDSFGSINPDFRGHFPDLSFAWATRNNFAELTHFSGVQWQLRYAFNRSPEGLDSFYSVFLGRALKQLDDVSRVRILAASGVRTLLLPRALADVPADEARLLHQRPSVGYDLHVYELLRAAPDFQLVGSVFRAIDITAALQRLTADDFDPRTTAVVKGSGPTSQYEVLGAAGQVTANAEDAESVVLSVESASGGIVATQRAWLPIYRATVDGREVEPVVINGHRLGIEVPAGPHRVRIWADRRPTRVAWAVALLAALAVLWLASRRSDPEAPGTPVRADPEVPGTSCPPEAPGTTRQVLRIPSAIVGT